MPGRGAFPLQKRLVEVNADLPDGTTRHGSGCLVGGQAVLTAAHVVTGATRVWVRGVDKRVLPCREVDARFVGTQRTWRAARA